MKDKIFLIAMLAIFFARCNSNHDTEVQDEHNETKLQFTAYSNEFELFAEADPFVADKKSNVLSHFSTLPGFKALDSSIVTIRLIVNHEETIQTLYEPTRKGIYSFDIKPELTGNGQIVFDIKTEKGNFQVVVPQITVYATEQEAGEAAQKVVVSKTNTTVFTKEQSWKIDYSTDYPKEEPFGQVIKTTALVQSAQGDEIIVTAKTNGIVMLSKDNALEGKIVSSGQVLGAISGSEFADNNSSVRFAEAKNNFEKAESDYERAKELARDKIVSEKDLHSAKNHHDNAKAIFDNLNKNFSSSGQKISSPMNGFIKQLFVQNGSYVEAGQSLVTISQSKTLVLNAEVQQKFTSILGSVISANIRTIHDDQTYSIEQLNGRILSYGKAANNDNYLIPVKIQIDNKGSFISGGFVEIYLKTLTNTQALTVPNLSLLEDQGSYFVYVQLTPELFEKREVKVGFTDGFKTEILKGIAVNERVVTRGAILIKLAQATGTLDAHSGHVH